MDTKLFYTEFKDESTIISDCWKEFIDREWHDYFGFEVALIPASIWKQERILNLVNDAFPIKHAGIMKIQPYYNYDWHVDTDRGCGINMLLQHEESHCLFKRNTSYYGNGLHHELKYKPNTFYAFNPQKTHCVINFREPRYLFSCEFEQNSLSLSYEMLCKWMKENKL